MKPVLLSLCLVLLFVAGMASASPSDCPTCFFASDDGSLPDADPYAGCPNCIFSYDSSGSLIADNPYAGCPNCIFSYDSSGNLIADTSTGCSSCGISYGTTNTHRHLYFLQFYLICFTVRDHVHDPSRHPPHRF